MGKPDFKNEPWRWNRWFASEYDSEAANIADDFYLADKECDYALLSAQWMIKNKNGKALDPVFSVQEILIASRKPNFEVDPCARVIDSCWRAYVRWKLDEKPVVILPPPPEPPPVVVEEPKPKLPEVKVPNPPKKPFPTKRVLAVVVGVAVTASAFLPPPWNLLAHAALKLLQAAMGS